MKNANFQKDKVTTILGLILTIPSVLCLIGVLILTVFIEIKIDFKDLIYVAGGLLGVAILGILLIISPDTIIKGANKGIGKFDKK
jgi:energy-coupling factor transporter transmembrane protein EcfT